MFGKFRCFMGKNIKRSFNQTEDITKETLKEYQRKGAILIDVRSPQEYNEGHINGAICIPEYDISRSAESVLKDKNETIIVYCSSGYRSKRAQERLKKMGYKNVYNLYGGIE